jgi:predicted DNA-binding protein (MmcQ/YjbR family)
MKCDPELAIELREQFYSVKPGYHMNKKHWNTLENEGDVSDKKIFELTDLSYDLVVKGLTKKLKDELKLL